MNDAIFLSASVPDPKRSPDYAKSADTVAITAAVTALVYVALGRRTIIWGGHPAVTPMISVVAESMGVDYGKWVKLYQSKFFEADFPEDNARFKNVVFTEVVEGDCEKSLRHMRERMFRENKFKFAVFIGGMGGILDEFSLFRQMQPKAKCVPLLSTGGAVLDIPRAEFSWHADLESDLDFVSLLHRYLEIDNRELRYLSPVEQPQGKARFWKRITKSTTKKRPTRK